MQRVKCPLRLLVLVALAFHVGCGSSDTAPEPPPPEPLALQLVGDGIVTVSGRMSLRMREGMATEIAVSSSTRELTALEASSVAWASTAEEVASIDGGRIMANSPGAAVVTARVGDASVSVDVTVASALLGHWPIPGGYGVQFIKTGPNNTIEILLTSRNDDLILSGYQRLFQREPCRSCLLDSRFPLDSPYGTFHRTGRLTWEYRANYMSVTCGGGAGCQTHPQLIVRRATMNEEGDTLTLSLIDGSDDTATTTWTRLATPGAAQEPGPRGPSALDHADAETASQAQTRAATGTIGEADR